MTWSFLPHSRWSSQVIIRARVVQDQKADFWNHGSYEMFTPWTSLLTSVGSVSSLHSAIRILNKVFVAVSPVCMLCLYWSYQWWFSSLQSHSHCKPGDWMFNSSTWRRKILITEKSLVPNLSPISTIFGTSLDVNILSITIMTDHYNLP